MAKSEMVVNVNIADLPRFRLLVVELRAVGDRMVDDGCEHAEAFINALDRFVDASPTDDREPDR